MVRSAFSRGLSHGIPIALGYLSVSFGFGIQAVKLGIPVLEATLISLTNLTSAGQAAGIKIIAAAGGLIEMALTQLVINLRYALMGFSLTQKLDKSFGTKQRLIASFGITDELYALAASAEGKISPPYFYGLMTLPILGWTGGTLFGALAGEILPKTVTDAMGLLLYGMFLAIFVPAARKEKSVLVVVLTAAGISSLIRFLLPFISAGFAIIISALVASILGALLFPVEKEETK